MRDLSNDLFLFDVDGVLTDAAARPDGDAISLVAGLGRRGARLGFVTGRSRTWIERRLVPLLAVEIGADWKPGALLAAEMGALVKRGLNADDWVVRSEYVVPEACRSTLEAGCDNPGLSPYLEWDGTKEATATAEARHKPGDDQHTARTRAALAEYEIWARPVAAAHGCRAAMSTYALDVLRRSLSKRVGAGWVLDAASVSGVVHVFGDSPGDVAMAEEAVERGLAATFTWLGVGQPPTCPVPVTRPANPHAVGTREALGRFFD